MAGACGIRAEALHGTLPSRTLPAVGVSVTTRGDGALRVHAGVPSLASEDVPPSHTRWEAVRRSQK